MAKLNIGLGAGRTGIVSGGAPTFSSAVSSMAFGRGQGGMPKVMTIVLCEDEVYKTDGTSTALADIYDIPEVRNLGPMIEQIRVHYVCEGASTNFRAKVSMSWSVLGRTWSTPVDLQTALTGNQTGNIGSWYTTDANFGLNLRFMIDVSNSAGTAIETGRVTVVLEIELKS